MHDDLRAAVAADMPRLKELLASLVRMESVSADGYDPKGVRDAAETIVDMLDGPGSRTRSYSNPPAATPPSSPRSRAPRVPPRPSSTPTTTSSPPDPSMSGKRARSTRSSATAGSMAAVPAMTRRAS